MSLSFTKAQKIETQILLSLKYYFLVEGKKKIILPKTSMFTKITKRKLTVKKEKTTDAINYIEKSFKEDDYLLFINDQFESKIKLLQTNDDYDLFKYDIAVKAILYNADLVSSKEAIIKRLMTALFTNTEEINALFRAVGDVYKTISGSNFDIASLQRQTELVMLAKTHLDIIISPLDISKKSGIIEKKAEYFSDLSLTNFNYILTQEALFLTQAKVLLKKSEQYYKAIFTYKLKGINMLRNNIAESLFEKWSDTKVNKEKLISLSRFDVFILDMIKV